MSEAVALRFQVGARTLAAIPRRLVRVPLSLEDALAERLPALPPLAPGDHGHAITSLPEARLQELVGAGQGSLAFVRQRYVRHYADLTIGAEAYRAGLSANTRSQLKRKAARIAARSGGRLDVRRFRTPDEMAAFHPVARALAQTTYQEKLLGAGLPDTPEFLDAMYRMAAADQVRAWLLYVDDVPAAYLYCPAQGRDLLYEYVGHDPAFADLSPGSVLQMEALGDLMVEGRFRRFDFTEGDGQHKRQFATDGVACVDLLLLRATPLNRLVVLALSSFDRAMELAKRAARHPALARLAKRVRRA